MIYSFVSFLGILIGYFIAKSTKEELKPGMKYFIILELIILFLISSLFLFYSPDLFLFIFGLLFGFVFRFEYFYFGIGLFSLIFNLDLSFLISSLIFIYGLPYGGILFYTKKIKLLFFHLILFFIPLILYFFNYNLLPFAGGALLIIFIIRLYDLVRKYFF